MRNGVFLCLLLVGLAACSPKAYITKQLVKAETQFHDHIGFMLYDLGKKKSVVEYNSAKYFTPASNTKIATFYTALKLLGDSVPALKYQVRNDSLVFWGLGDPSFLYQNTFHNNWTYNFLSQSKQKLFFSSSNFNDEHFGPGWAWDDYNEDYSVERSPLPLFGNLISMVNKKGNWVTEPLLFMNHFTVADTVKGKVGAVRDRDSNNLLFFPSKAAASRWQVPYSYSSDLLTELLADTLKREITEVKMPLPKEAKTINSIPTDSLYSVMMKVSDNFIAEQLLLACAAKVSDTLNTDIAIKYSLTHFLLDLPDDLRWVDGSGLSRYNLFTPRSIVALWQKLYEQVPQQRLFKLLAAGGEPGTLQSFYQAGKPYVFGKTGSLSNNHCLSGYLITKKGKIFIISFMNSNFVAPSREVRAMMQRVLTHLHDTY
jgi:D-alanyl-D-alanine carboxypeptidase/D-alanyl-D-alanine-endopeptidase (penicillin-binding protein 4)